MYKTKTQLNTTLDTKKERFAYVALVMRGDAYIPGAIILAHSLKRTGTLHDIVCMITSDVSQAAKEALLAIYDVVVSIDYLRYPTKPLLTTKQQNMYDHWMSDSLTMFQSLGLTQYTKICQLDVDVVVLRNMDSVFNTKTPASCFINPWLSNSRMNTFYPRYMHHGQLVSKQSIQKAIYSRKTSFVGGCNCIVIEPSDQVLEKFKLCIENLIAIHGTLGFPGNFSGINEQSMAYFYAVEMDKPMYCIGNEYQCVPWKQERKHSGVPPYLFHYFNIKPWDMQNNEPYPDLAIWWSLALECCLKYWKNPLFENFLFPSDKTYTLKSITDTNEKNWENPHQCFCCKKTDHLFWDFKSVKCLCPEIPDFSALFYKKLEITDSLLVIKE